MDPNGKTINPPVIGQSSQVATTPGQPGVVPQNTQQVPVMQTATSEETKTIVTVLLLIFVYPIGLVVAWIWPKWRWWVKLLISIPVLFFILAILSVFALIAINPAAQIQKAGKVQFMNECTKMYTQQECEDQYSNMQLTEPNSSAPIGE